MFLLYTVFIILQISLSFSFASTDFKRKLFDQQKNKRIISSNTTLSIDIARSSVECAGVCSLVRKCCCTSYETESGRCILDTQSTPETETTDESNVMVKIPDSIGNLQLRDCSDLPLCTKSGVFEIYPDVTNKIDVYCDMDTNGGGWTIVQRRVDDSVDFFRYWNDYKNGFGSVSGNHWLGNDNLHVLTTSRNYVVRFEVHDFNNNTAYAEYQSFKVDNEASQYRVTFSGYTGTAGNGFEVNNGMKFTTRDRDNDLHPYHCGLGQQGAWWYYKCGITSLNGRYKPEGTTGAKMIQWKTWRNTTMRATAMKIRPMN
ncbi:Techylectin-5B,Tenascin-N,Fibrinogen C domain-containing protein 1-A,Fibrinogen C domain-containing protein 1,Fibrinogen C domain-containing protein 1-B,Angiopoietin-2,Tenascin-X,Ficolin-2,Fibrinogen alpha chain,Ficolin-1,Microfibril-associated glycoprotein 4,Techylectin-5A,Ryncolin-4 [Mytilus edulis]|uniref:Fibrinogen C-terminal domain-containing protein n=1 Tax=Mytilus edulis TaxID=6550 RepID=A0A8S3TX96_MYTED|nr:Techylectin-5B,Tenascin-N,Fibrinogen C domain-containing protein 1-A,Fibrinogen C domain-containing protein 1,Fibrinogen C domain-containing protein 1-B,Angiopoietin-2,Tenascin-X,Ficolin-2,Fibrinogen alpha chain,Ficolin-1,Microfibril-associated glycoprotein 4,Techylectin-5A,Ryncolin-4 [Mytilus edulis]